MFFILRFPEAGNYHNLTKIDEILNCFQKSSTLIYFLFFDISIKNLGVYNSQ